MPIYNRHWINPNGGGTDAAQLQHRGPALEIEVSVPPGYAAALIDEKQPVPNAINGTALIDTGAAFTAVDLAILESLLLQPVSTIQVTGPTGDEEQGVYRCQIALLGTHIPPFEQMVVGSRLSKFGHAALIGRDLLAGSLLVCDGVHGQWTIAV